MDKILEKSGYIVIVTLVVLGLLLLMRKIREGALVQLKTTLYIDHDPIKYLAMLKTWKLKVLLRRSTLELMRLEGLLYTGDNTSIEQEIEVIGKLRLSRAEKLDFSQRKLSYYLSVGRNEDAEASLAEIKEIIKNEPDKQLCEIGEEADMLVRLYVRHDQSLLPALEAKARAQTGVQLGITQFRMAKLYHYGDNDASARGCLKKAAANLEGTSWHSIAQKALEDINILEKN